MNSRDRTRSDDFAGSIRMIAIVVVGSFAAGLVPLAYGLWATTGDGQIIVPTEAALWSDAWREVD